MAMSALIKSLEDTMRSDAGLNGDAQYIEQITWLLFLKAFDAKEMEWELNPNSKPVIPIGYRWRDWAEDKEGITGDALMSFIDDLFHTLKDLDTSDGDMRKFIVKGIFEDTNNYMKSGINLRKLINKMNDKVDFIDATQKHTFNDLYEGMLKDLQSAGKAGEFYTPRPVTNFIVEKVNPKLGEIVLDPACGTGGFLTSTINHFGKINTVEEYELLQKSVNGWEKKPLPYLLAMTNLILHDIEVPQIKHQNSLARPLSDYTAKDKVDVIVANPPFGGSEDAIIKKNFPSEVQTSETADLFLVLMMHLLKDKGRCGIVLPDSFMFDGGVKNTIKQKLLEEYGLHTIIRIPPVFKPYASVKTNLLFFQKGVKSKGVWVYRLDMPEGVKNFTKTKPMEDRHFDPVREWWDNRKEIVIDGNYKSKFYTIQELKDFNYDFDKCCPFPKDENIILEPNEIIYNYKNRTQEITSLINKQIDLLTQGLDCNYIGDFNANIQLCNDLVLINQKFAEDLFQSILFQTVQGKISSNVKFNDNIEITLNHIYSCKKEEIKNGLVIDKKHTPDVVKDDEIPFEIPNSWKWVKLGDITTFYAGKTPERHNVNYWKNPTTPWVSITDMINNGITMETKEKISDLAVKDCLQKCVSPKGTLIMSFKLTIGKVSYLGIDATHNEAIISIFPFAKDDKLEILKNYLFTILPFMANYGDSKNAIKGRTLNATSLTNLYIPLPSFEEQKYIVIKVKDLRKLVDTLN